MKPLPPTAAALLAILVENGGRLDYHDPRVTISGLTALRHRGLAVVEQRPATIVLTAAGRERAALAAAESKET